jgi:hypothetical protein
VAEAAHRPYGAFMSALIVLLLVVFVVLAVLGFVIKGLLWLAILGIVLFALTAFGGWVSRKTRT